MGCISFSEKILDRIYRISRKRDCGAAAVAVLLRALRFRRDASSYALHGDGGTR
jgi:hypothetical protein